MSNQWRRLNTILSGIAVALAAVPAARAQPPFPGASYSAPLTNASLVRILLTELDPGRRAEAARLLGASSDPKAVQALSTAAYEDPDARVRQEATEALSRIRGALGGGVVPTPASVPTWPPIGPPANPLWNPGPPAPPVVVQPPPVVQPPVVIQAAPVVQPPVDPQVELVQAWYQRYLRRSIDITGLQSWVSLLRQGASHDDVKAALLGSPEYYQLYGNRPVAFVTGLYTDILRRSPNREELALWLNRLRQLRDDRTRLAGDFLVAASGELQRHPAHGHYEIRR
jgi:hypothetical protein